MAGHGILVVDDDPASGRYMALALAPTKRPVRLASDGIEAILAIEREVPALVISDLQMPRMDGIELLARVKDRWPDVAVILVSVAHDAPLIVQAMQGGAVNYLVKPVAPAVLQSASANALARQATPVVQEQPSEILGISPAILQVRHLVTLAARSEANVIITGQTGTGKELVARAIHRLSSNSPRPFVAHNCAVSTGELFDSEFFGHRRGAFTGADRDRVGLLRQADGGILLLDELECLSLGNQAKLLRVLDSGEVRALGSEELRSISVRFLAATNRSPADLFASGDLRQDLYYRLRGFQIELPFLRERDEDIPVLAVHYVGARNKVLTPAALQALRRCAWPGNVRQLHSVLEWACDTSRATEIDVRHLDLSAAGPGAGEAPAPRGRARELSLRESERQTIASALVESGGSLGRAAKTLGIHRSTLRRKLRELEIPTVPPSRNPSGRT